jgi:hypothetical protein
MPTKVVLRIIYPAHDVLNTETDRDECMDPSEHAQRATSIRVSYAQLNEICYGTEYNHQPDPRIEAM